MIVNVRESKARLSELLAKANAGEDVVITVRGKPSARLVPLQPERATPDMRSWARELETRAGKEVKTSSDSSSEIINDLREERW